VQKGSQLYIEGKLRTRSWEDQQGNKRYVTEILADKIELLGKKDNNQQQPKQQAPVQQRPQQHQTTAMPYPTETVDDDLPFN
jgi:single-strand DNA-binding protein